VYNRDLETLIEILNQNITNNNYTPFNELESIKIREYHKNCFDNNYKLPYDNYEGAIYDAVTGIKISSGYTRLVIGDYGAYLEISEQIEFNNLYIKNGQEWRLDRQKYPNSKYYWYVTNNEEDATKVYYQIKTVKYADYKVGYYYVSPYEVIFE